MERMAQRILSPGVTADSTLCAPPLTRRERWAILAFVSAGVTIAGVLSLTRDGDAFQFAFEAVVIALLAGFVVSPALAVAAFGALVVVAIWAGLWTEVLVGLAVAAGLAARTAGARLFTVFAGFLLLAATAATVSAAAAPLMTIVIALLFAMVSGAVGLSLRCARVRERRLREQLSHSAVIEHEIRHSERALIADELHDVVSHDLTAVVMRAELMALERDPQTLVESHRSIREAARTALRDLHRVVSRVDSERAVPMRPLETTLAEAVRHLERAGYLITASISVSVLPPLIEATLARMLREAVTNVLKHAGFGAVGIMIAVENACVVLEVRSAIGRRRAWPPLPSSGQGNLRMAERAGLLGGDFRSQREGTQWVVSARLPLR